MSSIKPAFMQPGGMLILITIFPGRMKLGKLFGLRSGVKLHKQLGWTTYKVEALQSDRSPFAHTPRNSIILRAKLSLQSEELFVSINAIPVQDHGTVYPENLITMLKS